MFKKMTLVLTIALTGNNCFGMKKSNKNQNPFSAATLAILNFFFNPNKPKQIESTPPTITNKEFVCEVKHPEAITDPRLQRAVAKADATASQLLEEDKDIKAKVDLYYAQAIQKYKTKK